MNGCFGYCTSFDRAGECLWFKVGVSSGPDVNSDMYDYSTYIRNFFF